MKKSMRFLLCLAAILLLLTLTASRYNSFTLENNTTGIIPGTEGHCFKTVYGTKDGVEEFLTLLGDYDGKNTGTLTSGYKHNYDTCYNITPDDIKLEKPRCKIFKFSEDSLSVLQYKGELYVLGMSFGGYGVVDMKLADLNEDGEKELYFTYSWGSGMHRSHISYFDFAEKKQYLIDFVYMDHDMMIVEDSEVGISLYHTNIRFNYYSITDYNLKAGKLLYSLKPGKLLGKLVFKNGAVVVE